MGLRFMLILMLVSAPAFAQENTSTIAIPATSTRTYAPHKNFFSSNIAAMNRTSFGLGYSRALTGRFLVGVAGTAQAEHESSQTSGDLDKAQYYKDTVTDSSQSLEINSTFYFRENGYARWGFLLKGGIGHAWNKAKADWGRYDRDPSFFKWGSDDKRLRESGGDERKWESTYGRVGGYYQMAFNTHSTAPVSHLLQFGISALQMDQRKTVRATKPNGESFQKTIPDSQVGAEINYALSF